MTASLPAEVPAHSLESFALHFAMPVQQELGLAIAMVLTFAGMVLHWQLPRTRISMEERIKDGKITESEARTRLKIFNWCAPVVTFVGIAMLVGIMLAFAQP